jgi:glycosyltransferase involved in cell wall biosynthesis
VNLCRDTPLYNAAVSCITYLDAVRFEADREYWQKRGMETKFILEGVDTEAALGAMPARSAYGIPENSVVLATAGHDLDKSLTGEFIDTVIAILRAHPNAIYLLIGDAELAWQKRKFDSAGVGKRVGFAGKRKDLPGFLRIADVYLAEFPTAGSYGVLQAMSVERPVVAAKCGDEAENSQAATLVGSEGVILGKDTAAYIDRVGKIIKDKSYRAKLGKMMRTRIEQHFSFAQTTRQFEQMFDQLIQRRIDNAQGAGSAGATRIATQERDQPIADVA